MLNEPRLGWKYSCLLEVCFDVEDLYDCEDSQQSELSPT